MVFSSLFYQKLYPKHPHPIPLKQHLYPCYTRTYTRNYVDFIAFIPYVVRFARSHARAFGQEKTMQGLHLFGCDLARLLRLLRLCYVLEFKKNQ